MFFTSCKNISRIGKKALLLWHEQEEKNNSISGA